MNEHTLSELKPKSNSHFKDYMSALKFNIKMIWNVYLACNLLSDIYESFTFVFRESVEMKY